MERSTCACLTVGLLLVLAGKGVAQQETLSRLAPMDLTTTAAERAAAAGERGLLYLKSAQDEQSGGWAQHEGYKFNSNYQVTEKDQLHPGVTGLILRAYLDAGHRPDVPGPYRTLMSRGTAFLTESTTLSGRIGGPSSRMKSHGYAMLYLCRLCEVCPQPDVAGKTQRAVDFVVRAQGAGGGWRYKPFSKESDILVTSVQTLALQKARDAGLRVPRRTLERARACVVEHRAREGAGAPFTYQAKERSRGTFTSVAAALAALDLSEDVRDASLAWLAQEWVKLQKNFPSHYLLYHGVTCLTDAARRHSIPPALMSEVQRHLIRTQDPDGSWPCDVGPGRAYATAVACAFLARQR